MVREGRRRQILPLKSGWSDNFKYAIIESDVGKPQVAAGNSLRNERSSGKATE